MGGQTPGRPEARSGVRDEDIDTFVTIREVRGSSTRTGGVL